MKTAWSQNYNFSNVSEASELDAQVLKILVNQRVAIDFSTKVDMHTANTQDLRKSNRFHIKLCCNHNS